MWGVDFEVYGLSINALVVSSNSCRLVLNLALHILEFREPPIRYVMEFGPLGLCSNGSCGVRFRRIVIVRGDVDKLEDEGSASNNATTTREKVSADYVLEDWGLSRRLRTYNDLEAGVSIWEEEKVHEAIHTIWGRSKLSLPIVLNTKSWSLLTIPSKSSPREAILLLCWMQTMLGRGGGARTFSGRRVDESQKSWLDLRKMSKARRDECRVYGLQGKPEAFDSHKYRFLLCRVARCVEEPPFYQGSTWYWLYASLWSSPALATFKRHTRLLSDFWRRDRVTLLNLPQDLYHKSFYKE